MSVYRVGEMWGIFPDVQIFGSGWVSQLTPIEDGIG